MSVLCDDGLLLARSVDEAMMMVRDMELKAAEFGLKINRGKSRCLVFNARQLGQDMPDVIEGMEVVEEIKYLGVVVQNKRSCFKTEMERKLDLAQKMANVTYSVVERSCSRLIIGKCYWKSVILPRVLHGNSVIPWTAVNMQKLQRIENGVWRQVLGAPDYTPIAALQGDVGVSSTESRDIKEKLMFVKFVLDQGNELIRSVLESWQEMNSGRWMVVLRSYMEKVGVSWRDLRRESRNEITQRVNRWEQERWRREVADRSTLELYGLKVEIGGEDEIYRNGFGYQLLFRCRANVLKLNWRERFVGGRTECDVCGAEVETLRHFLMNCPGLEEVREECAGVSGWSMERVLMLAGEVGDRVEDAVQYIEMLWRERGRLRAVDG